MEYLIADNLKSIDALKSSLLEIIQPQIDNESSIDIEIKQRGSPIESISNKLPKTLVFDTSETSNNINCESVRILCKENLFDKLEYELEHTHTFPCPEVANFVLNIQISQISEILCLCSLWSYFKHLSRQNKDQKSLEGN